MKRNLKINYAKTMAALMAINLTTTATMPTVFASDVINSEAYSQNTENVRIEYYQGKSVYLYFDKELDSSSFLDTETGELAQTNEEIHNKGFTLKINGEEAKVRNISDVSIGDKNNDETKTNVIALTLDFVPTFKSSYTISYDSTKGNLKYKDGEQVQNFSLNLEKNSGVSTDSSGSLEDSVITDDSISSDTNISTDVNTENVRVEYYQGRSLYLYFDKELDSSSILDTETGELNQTNEKIYNKGFTLKINGEEAKVKTITDVSIGDKNNDETKTDVIALTLEFVPKFEANSTYTISYDSTKGNLKYKNGEKVKSFSLELDKNSGVSVDGSENTDSSNDSVDATQPIPTQPSETEPVSPSAPPVEVPVEKENVKIDYHQGRSVYLYFDKKIKVDGIKNQQDSEFFADGFRLLKNNVAYRYRTISDVSVGDTYNDKVSTNVVALTLDFIPSFNDKYSIEYDASKGNLYYEDGTKVGSFTLEFTKNAGVSTGSNENQGNEGSTGATTPPSTEQPSSPSQEVKVKVDYCRGKSVYLYFDKPLRVNTVSSKEIGEYTDGFRLTKDGATFDKTVNDVSVGDTYNDGIKTNVIALTLEFAPSFENPYTLEYNSEKGKLEFIDGEKVGSFKLVLDKNTGVNTDDSGSVVIPPTDVTPSPVPPVTEPEKPELSPSPEEPLPVPPVTEPEIKPEPAPSPEEPLPVPPVTEPEIKPEPAPSPEEPLPVPPVTEPEIKPEPAPSPEEPLPVPPVTEPEIKPEPAPSPEKPSLDKPETTPEVKPDNSGSTGGGGSSSSGGSSGGGSSSSSGGSSGGGGSSSSGGSSGGRGESSGNKKPESNPQKPETDKKDDDKSKLETDKIEIEKNDKVITEENKLVSMINLVSVDNQEKPKEFKDIKDSYWAKSHIDKLSKVGVIDNTQDEFSPNEKINREDFVVMVVKLLGLNTEDKNVFSDVDVNSKNAPYIATAYEVGIVSGNNGMFNPKNDITRQDAMVMTARVLKKLGISVNNDTSSLNEFKDMKKISNYAVEDVAILVNLGIINGNNGNINPKDNLSKVEMATIISKLYDILQNEF